MEKKKPMDTSDLKEESLESYSKKGQKSLKKVREEEVERLKMQESQTTIEMPIGRNTQARTVKGCPQPSVIFK